MAATRRSIAVACLIFLLLATIFTLVALFTPGWRAYTSPGSPNIGLVSRYCGNGAHQLSYQDCKQAWQAKAAYEKVTIALVVLAVLLEVLAIALIFIAMFSRVTIVFCVLATILLLVALLVYGLGRSTDPLALSSTSFEIIANAALGYSYWILLVAVLFLICASVAAVVHHHAVVREYIQGFNPPHHPGLAA